MVIDKMIMIALLHQETDYAEILADCEDIEMVDAESEKAADIASVGYPGYILA